MTPLLPPLPIVTLAGFGGWRHRRFRRYMGESVTDTVNNDIGFRVFRNGFEPKDGVR